MTERKHYNWPEFISLIEELDVIFGEHPSNESTIVTIEDDGEVSEISVKHLNGGYVKFGTKKKILVN